MKLSFILQNERSIINDVILDLEIRQKAITHQNVISLYKKQDKDGFISFCREEQKKEKRIVSPSTYKQHMEASTILKSMPQLKT